MSDSSCNLFWQDSEGPRVIRAGFAVHVEPGSPALYHLVLTLFNQAYSINVFNSWYIVYTGSIQPIHVVLPRLRLGVYSVWCTDFRQLLPNSLIITIITWEQTNIARHAL